MRTVRIALAVLLLVCAAAQADETRGHAMLNQARTGARSMEAHYEALRSGANEVAAEKLEEAKKVFTEVTQWGMTLAPEKFGAAPDAAQYAEAMELAEQYDLAARGYQRAYNLDPQETYAIAAARNYRHISPSWFDEAVDLLTPLATDSTNPILHEELGRIYHASSLLELASESYIRALELDAESQTAKLGLALLDIGNARVAEGNLALTELGPLDIELGRYLDEELPGALARLELRQLAFAETPQNHAAYAQLLIRVGREFDALLAIEHAVMLDDTEYQWFNLMGGLLMQQGLAERAAKSYRQSLALNADQPRTRQIIGQIENTPNSQP